MADQPRIHIDSDWKAQAQAEKERLAREAEAKKPAPAPPGSPEAAAGPQGRDPQAVDFHALVASIINQALLYMGAIPDPQTGQGMVHLELARFNIDLLGVLEAKTKGNLTEEEGKLLTQALHELRLSFLQLSKQVAEHLKKQSEAGMKPGPKLAQ